MNKLSIERRAAILGALTEGMSIRSVNRMFGVHATSILRLLADAGEQVGWAESAKPTVSAG